MSKSQPMRKSGWTDQEKKTLTRILGGFTRDQLDAAYYEASRVLKRPVSFESARYALGRKPGVFCKMPPTPPPDPVQRKEAADKHGRLTAEIESLVGQIQEARARQAFLDEVISHKPPPRILCREKISGIREMTATALASDWHVEETVEPESVAHVNAYNLDVAALRIDRYFQSIIWYIEHHRASGRILIRDLVWWLGGDLMTGYIHEELIESNGLSPTETIIWLMPRLAEGLQLMLDTLKLESIIIPCSFGNHGRTTMKKRISTGYKNSYEWMMYVLLARMFKNDPRVRFEITASAHQYVDVYDFPLHFHHGDELKYQGGVGGLGIPYLKRIPQWDRVRKCHVHNIGHWHQLLDFGPGVVNGSLIGYNAFAQSIGASPEVPQQLMYFVDSKRGKCMPTSLWVEESAPRL